MTYYGNKYTYELGSKMGEGGEGTVFALKSSRRYIAKVYKPKSITPQGLSDFNNKLKLLEEKILYMIDNKPSKSILNQIAWPRDVLRDEKGNFVGFVMPKMDFNRVLRDGIYSYPPNIDMSIEQKIIIAINICIVISEVHKAGYIFGDFNPKNIGINTQTGYVAFIDTDTYHVITNEKTYRCTVAYHGYIAPELIRIRKEYGDFTNSPLPTFTKETDHFALAVHIFKLLMNGVSPFMGILEISTSSDCLPGSEDEAIEQGLYCFKEGNRPKNPATLPLSVLPRRIQEAFNKTFIEGAEHPTARISPEEWIEILDDYRDSLIQCSKNPLHYYYIENINCPYCQADLKYNKWIASGIKKKNEQVAFVEPIQDTQKAKLKQSTESNIIKNSTLTKVDTQLNKRATRSIIKNILFPAALVMVISVFVCLYVVIAKTGATAMDSITNSTNGMIEVVGEPDFELLNKLNNTAQEYLNEGFLNLGQAGNEINALLEYTTINSPKYDKGDIINASSGYYRLNDYNVTPLSASFFIPRGINPDTSTGLLKINYRIYVNLDKSLDEAPVKEVYKNFSEYIYVSFIWDVMLEQNGSLSLNTADFMFDYLNSDTDYNSWYDINIISLKNEYTIDEYLFKEREYEEI